MRGGEPRAEQGWGPVERLPPGEGRSFGKDRDQRTPLHWGAVSEPLVYRVDLSAELAEWSEGASQLWGRVRSGT